MISGIHNKEQAQRVAKALLSVQAVFLRPDDLFTWASGIRSPVYCDNRLTLAHPDVRRMIAEEMAAVVRDRFPSCDAVMGTSTSGIPHAAIVSEILRLPMGYVRGAAKEHGRNNRVEGAPAGGKKAVVIEDLISSGGSVLDVVQALREDGADVLGVVSIFTYNLKRGLDAFTAASVQNVSLCDIETLVGVALQEKYIDINGKKVIEDFIGRL
jgi:orotate phosphoribosyltransferase